MFKSFITLSTILLLAVSVGFAADIPTGKVVITIDRTQANDGHQMYNSYCAACHGADGRGNGSAAATLKTHPADLTNLAVNGKFPESHVYSILQFGTERNNSVMPAWGKIFRNMDTSHPIVADQRMSNLSQYLQKLQKH